MKKKMTTADIRQAVREAGRIADWEDSAAAFDEWLADFAEEKWDDGYERGFGDGHMHAWNADDNPYRKAE